MQQLSQVQTYLNGFLVALSDQIAAKVAEKVIKATGTAVGRSRLLTPDAAARYIGRTKYAIQHMIADGKLPVVRMDKRTFLDVRDLDELIDRSKFGTFGTL